MTRPRIATASAMLLATVSQTAAGGLATSCHEPVHRPPVYTEFSERVLLAPGARYVDVTPPIYGTRERQVLVSEGYDGWRQVQIRGHCR